MKKILKIIQNHLAHAPESCGMGDDTCMRWFVNVKNTHKKKKVSLLYCVYIYTFKNMMLKMILLEQNKVIPATLEASWQ